MLHAFNFPYCDRFSHLQWKATVLFYLFIHLGSAPILDGADPLDVRDNAPVLVRLPGPVDRQDQVHEVVFWVEHRGGSGDLLFRPDSCPMCFKELYKFGIVPFLKGAWPGSQYPADVVNGIRVVIEVQTPVRDLLLFIQCLFFC